MKRRFSLFTYPMMDMKAAEAELNRRAAAGWTAEWCRRQLGAAGQPPPEAAPPFPALPAGSDIGAPNSAPEPISKSPSRILLYEVVFQAGLYYHHIRIHLPRKNVLFG